MQVKDRAPSAPGPRAKAAHANRLRISCHPNVRRVPGPKIRPSRRKASARPHPAVVKGAAVVGQVAVDAGLEHVALTMLLLTESLVGVVEPHLRLCERERLGLPSGGALRAKVRLTTGTMLR